MATSEQFILVNTAEDWRALQYAREWCDISSAIDIATGHFEIDTSIVLERQTGDAFLTGADAIVDDAGLFVDEDKFVWPREIDPATWAEFRPNDGAADRRFIYISPAEIANAARFIVAKYPGIADDELDVAVLQTFGRKRRKKQVAAHLVKAKELL